MTTGLVVVNERIDDIPLLLAQMEKIQLARLLDEQFTRHGNWSGLSPGNLVQVWLAYILSEGDHRLNHVESWTKDRLMSLGKCLGKEIRALDFSDDRLGSVLSLLGHDEAFEQFEGNLNRTVLRVYDLRVKRVRIDSTSAKGYMSVTEDGLFQFGHSKDHRPDLPQLKINQSALDPLGIPLTTTIVSGEKADDPLYVPEIRKVQRSMLAQGVLYVGDCKMASLATRAYVASSSDYYLCPLSSVQIPDAMLAKLLEPVWNNEQALTPVYHPLSANEETPEQISEGFIYTQTLQSATDDGEIFTWDEQRLVVHSFKYAAKQEKSLQARTVEAEVAIARLNQHGRGKKTLDEKELQNAVEAILQKHNVPDLIQIEYRKETTRIQRKATRKREAYILVETRITVHTSLSTEAWSKAVRHLGWRVYACNDKELSLSEAVLAYRQEYLIEHGFARYKGKTLGLTPLYLSSTTRIKGLIRLLSIGLRVLCLLEFSVREALLQTEEKLSGIYKGNPKRATGRPTAEMLLKVFRGISLVIICINGVTHIDITKLTPVQEKILGLLGQSTKIYTGLSESSEPPGKLSER
jgi:transposase